MNLAEIIVRFKGNAEQAIERQIAGGFKTLPDHALALVVQLEDMAAALRSVEALAKVVIEDADARGDPGNKALAESVRDQARVVLGKLGE